MHYDASNICICFDKISFSPFVYQIRRIFRSSVGSHDHILFSTLGACYKVDNIGRLTTSVAPDADFAICVGVIILQVLHLDLAHSHASLSGSSSRMSGLSLARTITIKDLNKLLRDLLAIPKKLIKSLIIIIFPSFSILWTQRVPCI